ncbi:MAG: hypothetical protein ACK40X_08660 [Armatimonadota bacterium]
MKKMETSDIKTIQPLGFLPLLLKDFQPPTESFEPEGEWEHTYRLFVVGVIAEKYRQWGCVPSGTLQIKRTPKQDGNFALQVSVTSNQSLERGGIERIEAQIFCRNDPFASLMSWRKRSWLLTPQKQKAGIEELKLAIEMETAGQVKGGQIILRTDGRERKLTVPSPLTCDWAIIDVVQRLSRSGSQSPLQFAVLEELDFLRPNQRILQREPMEVEVDGKRFRWNCFVQFGDGVLPWTYCLDEHHRLVLAFSAMRAILLMR